MLHPIWRGEKKIPAGNQKHQTDIQDIFSPEWENKKKKQPKQKNKTKNFIHAYKPITPLSSPEKFYSL